MMEKVELKFLRIAYSHTHAGAYALVLGEAEGERRLPIIIGGNEAQSIALVIEQIKPARPPTPWRSAKAPYKPSAAACQQTA